ncbi:MAG: Protein of unknown function (Hypoth_ymh) [Candidatus Kentron sp. G]|nr:MAG: Protein of unknown function (Hypoth_ymh) [Candidatus Kentron sp. G]VFN04335.1 MAG: Protein of unknown function (Hypoth_ymh) [Candidatus Kentron sp. G]VFN05559.1 MAG: Protein of unknown function (Hypoth_ymh) [Candidatus Kentron sp. G]
MLRLVQCHVNITKALLLTAGQRHCFFLEINDWYHIAIKSGFTSGYQGGGPRGLSTVLQVLDERQIEIEEYEVSEALIARIDDCRLTISDIEEIKSARPVRPLRWYDYIYSVIGPATPDNRQLGKKFTAVVPFRIIDDRIMDLALILKEQPDASIMSAYRRLEDLVRKRSGLDMHGAKLFSKAFQPDDSVLFWKEESSAENQGKASLFSAVFMAFRNRRAHKELEQSEEESLREFLLLNELYLLEATATKRFPENR